MRRRCAAVFFSVSLLGSALPGYGADAKRVIAVTSTERVPFPAGGTIRVDHSYGYLAVEGWDEPEVEVTVTKSTDRLYAADEKEKVSEYFNQVRVTTERRTDNALVISTVLPVRNSFGRRLLPNKKHGITVDLTVRVPRDSQLVVHYDNGYVWVSDVTGDIEVKSHTGDMIVVLPEAGAYSIDAATRLGRVSSDFEGRARHEFLIGGQFAGTSGTSLRRVYLRMGRGSITIKEGSASGPAGNK
jgi:hypothetical protein